MNYILVMLFVLIGVGCTKAVPTFELLNNQSPKPKVSAESRITQGSANASSTNFRVEGSVNFQTPSSSSSSLTVKPKSP